jgi:hypothetical protein
MINANAVPDGYVSHENFDAFVYTFIMGEIDGIGSIGRGWGPDSSPEFVARIRLLSDVPRTDGKLIFGSSGVVMYPKCAEVINCMTEEVFNAFLDEVSTCITGAWPVKWKDLFSLREKVGALAEETKQKSCVAKQNQLWPYLDQEEGYMQDMDEEEDDALHLEADHLEENIF